MPVTIWNNGFSVEHPASINFNVIEDVRSKTSFVIKLKVPTSVSGETQHSSYRITWEFPQWTSKDKWDGQGESSKTVYPGEDTDWSETYTLSYYRSSGEDIFYGDSYSPVENVVWIRLYCSGMNLGHETFSLKIPVTARVTPPNRPPSAPSSISVPALYDWRTATISWGASSDPDNNLSGYQLYRRVGNESSGWGQIYKGNTRSFTDQMSKNWTGNVQYRVCAFDSQGLLSDYCTSSWKAILHNQPPTVPGSITVPDTIQSGTSIVIWWDASSDTDGNLSGYKLERRTNNGNWVQVYSGSACSYAETARGEWNTIEYRVRAFDSTGTYSNGYCNSSVISVMQTWPMYFGTGGTIRELRYISTGQDGVIRSVTHTYCYIDGVQREIYRLR